MCDTILNLTWWNDSFYSYKIVSELLKTCVNSSFTLCGKPQVKVIKKLKELLKFSDTHRQLLMDIFLTIFGFHSTY